MPLYRMNPGSGGSSTIAGHVATAPPSWKHPVTNVYFDPALQKIVGEYDDAGVSSGTIQSNPPVGKFVVTNIYYDPAAGVLQGEYNDGA